MASEPTANRACPGCGRPVESQWLFCPHCEERLRDTLGPPQRDAARPRPRTKSVLPDVLAVIGFLPVLGLLVALVGGVVTGESESIAFAGIALFVLFAVCGLFTYIRTHERGQAFRVTRVLFNSLLTAGAVVSALCVLMLAASIFFAIICAPCR